MHTGVLWLKYYQLLEVHKSESSVANQVRTLASVQISINQVLVQINCNTQIRDGFLEHAQACVASAPSQVVRRISLIRLFNDPLEITNRIIEPVKCKIKNTSEEQYRLVLGALLECSIQILFGILEHLDLGCRLDWFVH